MEHGAEDAIADAGGFEERFDGCHDAGRGNGGRIGRAGGIRLDARLHVRGEVREEPRGGFGGVVHALRRDRDHGVVGAERGGHCCADRRDHVEFVAEPDLAFGGVDVHVDGTGRHGEVDQRGLEPAAFEHGAAGFLDGAVDRCGFDGAGVHEDALFGAGIAREAASRDEAVHGDAAFRAGERQQRAGVFASEELADAREDGRSGRSGEQDASVGFQDERDVVVRQGDVREDFDDVAFLGRDGAEEVLARRNVEEEVAGDDLGAGRAAGGLLRDGLAARDEDLDALRRFAPARADGEACDGGDAGDGLAAESEGGDVEDVGLGGDLAGGMRIEAEQGVVGVHALAVVGDRDGAASAVLDRDGDLPCARVERILHELLHDGRGAFHDLARRDLVADLVAQLPDLAHDAVRFSGSGTSFAPDGMDSGMGDGSRNDMRSS